MKMKEVKSEQLKRELGEVKGEQLNISDEIEDEIEGSKE